MIGSYDVLTMADGDGGMSGVGLGGSSLGGGSGLGSGKDYGNNKCLGKVGVSVGMGDVNVFSIVVVVVSVVVGVGSAVHSVCCMVSESDIVNEVNLDRFCQSSAIPVRDVDLVY